MTFLHDKLDNELEAREEELHEKMDELRERLDEEDIRLTAEFPELDEEYNETWGRIQELQRTRELIKKVFN